MEFSIFRNFESSSFYFQFSKIRRFKSKFQNGDVQILIPTKIPHLHLFPQALLCGFSKPCRRACRDTGREHRCSGPIWRPGAWAPGACFGPEKRFSLPVSLHARRPGFENPQSKACGNKCRCL